LESSGQIARRFSALKITADKGEYEPPYFKWGGAAKIVAGAGVAYRPLIIEILARKSERIVLRSKTVLEIRL
jgi:hypothetical protein